MSRREIRYTVRLSEQEYQQLKKKILEDNEWTFKYGTKKDRVNISAYQRCFVPERKRRETVLPGTEKFKFSNTKNRSQY